MDATRADDEQKKLWDGRSGHAWVESQELLDRLFLPFENLLVDAVAAHSANRVLDVGCGTGSTTVAIARRLGATGTAVGIDLSNPMTDVARARAERERVPVRFLCADAQTYAFEAASFDMVVSRFGVMFFNDPVQAFANLRRAARDGAPLAAIAWRSTAENPFMTTAERAAAPLLPELPPRKQGAAGQFAFANDQRVNTILTESGWTGIEIRPLDVACTMPEQDLIALVTRLGPVGSFLQDADESTRARVIDAVRPAFDPYVRGTDVRFTAACWMLSARA